MPLPTFSNLPEDKRQKIIDCAVDEFARHDFDSASVSKIVARAGIAKGSLYQYFSDKRDLYEFLLTYAVEKKGELMAAASPPAGEMGLFQTLHWLFGEMTRFQALHPRLAQLGARASRNLSAVPDGLVQQAARSTRTYFAALIEKAKQTGEVRPDADAEAAAFMLTAAMSELTAYLAEQGTDTGSETYSQTFLAAAEKVYDQLLTILENGLRVNKE